MKTFKKILFWSLFFPLGLIVVLVGLIEGICIGISWLIDNFEYWCLKDDSL